MEKFPSYEEFLEKTCTKFRNEKSYNGYNVGELKSWLQKDIRRGNEEGAVWACVELYTMPKQSILTNLFNRLRIIAMEDIGIANVNAIKYVDEILSSLENEKGKPILPVKYEWVIKIAKLVRYLAKSEHIRLCSDYKAVFMTFKIREKLIEKFPDVYQTHLDVINFCKENTDINVLGDKLVELLKQKDECVFYIVEKILDKEKLDFKSLKSNKSIYYVMKKIYEVSNADLIHVLDKWLRKGIVNCKECNLVVYYILLYLIKNVKTMEMSNDEVIINNFTNKNIPLVPDYALDKHTISGIRNGKTSLDFAISGAFVENECIALLNERYREVYIFTKELENEKDKKKL